MTHGPIRQEYAYDLDKNLTGLTVRSGDALLARNSYTYDGNGNRTLKRQLGGETLYHYDPLNQLNKVEYPSYTEELFYDRAGNRTRRLVAGEEELYRYDPRNRLMAYTKNGATTPFQYDNAGNLLQDDKAKYTYDAFNRTTKVETFDGNVQVNRYDAEGLRHEMEENGRLVRFIFHKGESVAEQEENSNVIRLIRGSELIARSSDGESARTYYHYASDEMGSTTHIVDEDGNVQNRYEYDAWGKITVKEEAVPNRFTYYGQQIDPIAQQYYLRARFYNPVIGRFTQEDTYRGDGLNLYAYCANNPVYYVDPSGHSYSDETLAQFAEWFNSASKEDVKLLMSIKDVSIEIKTALRNQGSMHEWLPVSQAAISRGWGATAEDIWRWTTPTDSTYFVNIVNKKGILNSGFHGKNGSTAAHNQIIAMMQESTDIEEFKRKLNLWADEHVKLIDPNTGADILVGRNALPDGLRISELELDVSPRAIYRNK